MQNDPALRPLSEIPLQIPENWTVEAADIIPGGRWFVVLIGTWDDADLWHLQIFDLHVSPLIAAETLSLPLDFIITPQLSFQYDGEDVFVFILKSTATVLKFTPSATQERLRIHYTSSVTSLRCRGFLVQGPFLAAQTRIDEEYAVINWKTGELCVIKFPPGISGAYGVRISSRIYSSYPDSCRFDRGASYRSLRRHLRALTR